MTALVGVVVVFAAAAKLQVVEVESGTPGNNAASIAMNGASGGKAVKFGASTTSLGTSPSTAPSTSPGSGTNDPTAATCNSYAVVGTDAAFSVLKPTLCEDFNSDLGKFRPTAVAVATWLSSRIRPTILTAVT